MCFDKIYVDVDIISILKIMSRDSRRDNPTYLLISFNVKNIPHIPPGITRPEFSNREMQPLRYAPLKVEEYATQLVNDAVIW